MLRILHRGQVWSAALEAEGHGSPVRKLVTGRRKVVTGKIHGRKFDGGSIQWESAIERDFLVGELFTRDTVLVQGQPHTLRAWSDTGGFSHTPDFLLRKEGADVRDTVVEVKASYFASLPGADERLAVSAACHIAMGYDWSMRTEAEVQAQPRLANCCFLLRYRAAGVRQGLAPRIAALLDAAPSTLGVRACIARIDGRPETRFEIYSLACSGEVELDLDVPLGPDTPILRCRPGPLRGGRGSVPR
jgi:hypothetical protein